jgi:hypothetical protein
MFSALVQRRSAKSIEVALSHILGKPSSQSQPSPLCSAQDHFDRLAYQETSLRWSARSSTRNWRRIMLRPPRGRVRGGLVGAGKILCLCTGFLHDNHPESRNAHQSPRWRARAYGKQLSRWQMLFFCDWSKPWFPFVSDKVTLGLPRYLKTTKPPKNPYSLTSFLSAETNNSRFNK